MQEKERNVIERLFTDNVRRSEEEEEEPDFDLSLNMDDVT